MRGCWLLANCGLFLSAGVVLAQPPLAPQSPPSSQSPNLPYSPPRPPERVPPVAPLQPRTLPPSLTSSPKSTGRPVAAPQEMPLPQKENLFAVNAQDIALKRVAGGAWQLWMGQKLLRDFGAGDVAEMNARDAARVFRDIHPTEWGVIGSPRPVVEYGLVNGRPPLAAGLPGGKSAGVVPAGGSGPLVSGAGAKAIIPIDLKTVRVEAVRGVWCLRDDAMIHFNFGANRADADQALAVVHRYGFNRIGVVGAPAPVMNYLFASTDNAPQPDAGQFAKAALQAQIDGLSRVGIPVAGAGYVGEMFRFDPRRLEVRKDGGEWQIVWGTELIGRFGPSEYAARDALRAIQDSRFNEFCTVGSRGLTFFLVNGKAPTRVPFHVQGRRFDPNSLRVSKSGEKWTVTEANRHLLDCASAEEGETLIRVLKSFQFDQLCHLGPSPSVGVSFFAKGR